MIQRFPKQGTLAWFMFGEEVVKVKITKKWTDRVAYIKPTQVATVRVVELYNNSKHYNIGSKIVIDEPEQLSYNEQDIIKRIMGR